MRGTDAAPWAATYVNAVLAICVVLVPAVAVGTAGVPVNVGEARSAYGVSKFVNPAPLTVPVADRFVADTALGVVEPNAGGAA